MINEETMRKLKEMNLSEFIAAIDLQSSDSNTQILPFDERFQRIIDYVYQEKYNSRIQRMIKQAKFRFPHADVTNILYTDRRLDETKLKNIALCQFIQNSTNLIFQGFTGAGKTYLACAVGKQACKNQIKTRYIRLPDLLTEYGESIISSSKRARMISRYSRIPLLILDEWLLEDISEEEQHFIFELMERRYDIASTIFCTQYKKEDWHSRLGGGVHADAIMDRIVHNAIWIDTGTLNMREYCARKKL